MKNSLRFRAIALGSLGWGISWGLSRGLMIAYHESIPKFFFQPPEFYVGWGNKMTAFFVLGFFLAALSTALMLWKSIPGVQAWHGIAIVILWTASSCPLGFVLVHISKFTGPEILAVVGMIFYGVIVPPSMVIFGWINGALTAWIAKRASPELQEMRVWKKGFAWSAALLLGGILASFPTWYTGFLGGLLAGMIGNGALIPREAQPHQEETAPLPG